MILCSMSSAKTLGGGNDVWKPWKRNIEAERLPESHKIIVKLAGQTVRVSPYAKVG